MMSTSDAQGSQSSEAFQLAGQKAATAFAHYEGTPTPQSVQQGQEPTELQSALGGSESDSFVSQQCAAYDGDFQVCIVL